MLQDVENLIRRLKEELITWQEAMDIVGTWPKPWHTPEWKQARDQLIKSACDQCGSTTPPMVLHHLKTYPTWSECKQRVQGPLWEKYKEAHPIVKPPLPLIDRQACPKCQSTSVRFYKREDVWKCHGQTRGRTCGHRFDTPITIQGQDPAAVHERSLWWQAQSRTVWEEFQKEHDASTGKAATLRYLENRIRYLSLTDTATFCKKCAFLWDKQGVKLCSHCKSQWHPLYLRMCNTCKGRVAVESDAT